MKLKNETLKQVIGTFEKRDDVFLSLINGEGEIKYANPVMLDTFHLENFEKTPVNFLDLLHPFNLSDFKSAMRESASRSKVPSMELYLKNGYYHPMKWEINYVDSNTEDTKGFLCVGQKLLDDDRIQKFNQLGEKNYQLIVEGLGAGVLFQDRKGELIAANKKTAEIFNVTLERLYQLTDIASHWNHAWEIKNQEGVIVPFEQTPFMAALRTGAPQVQELRITLRDGTVKWIHFTSQPLKDDNSKAPYAVVSNILDVTEQHELAERLHEREAVLGIFMNHTPNLAWVIDEDGRLVFASDAFYEFLRIKKEDSLNQKLSDLVPAIIETQVYSRHLQSLKTGESTELVEKVAMADGTNHVFHINLFPIDTGSGKKLMGGHAVNLADKYEYEKKLKETNDRLLMLARATSDAIWEWDMQTGRIFRNDALMDMIGYQSEAPKGLSWWFRRIHPEDRNRVSDKVRDITEKGLQSWEDAYRFKCATGEYKSMHDRGFVVYENGLPVKMIGCLQDVSGVKELEEQLMEAKLVRQKEISETIIRVQEKERTRIGHELHDNVNQILSTCKLFVDMITPANPNEIQFKQKSLDYIMLAIEEIRKLSKDMVVPQLTHDSLVDNIYDVIEDLEMSTDITIRFTHDHDNELLSPDKKVTLFRVLQEQLKNILKHAQATQIDIFLQCKAEMAELVIRDNGIGFDARKTHRGIGLSNIFERTRFYGGSVDVDTQPGNGCVVTVKLPVD